MKIIFNNLGDISTFKCDLDCDNCVLDEEGFNEFYKSIECANCGEKLEPLYCALIWRIKEYIPKNYKHFCCECYEIRAIR